MKPVGRTPIDILQTTSYSNTLSWMKIVGGGGPGLLTWWSSSIMWVGASIFSKCHHRGCLNNPIFSNLGLCATCWVRFCVITNWDLHQWVIPSPLSIALYVLLEENITRKWLSLSLDLFFKIVIFQVSFLLLFSIAIYSPSYFLLVGLLLRHVALFQSRTI